MKILIAYFSAGGTTEKMAEYIAEGVRFSGQEAVVRKIEGMKTMTDLAGYDGYIFGSPTYSLDVPEPMKTFLLMLKKADIEGKPSGAFGPFTHDVSYGHDNYAPAIIFDTLQRDYKTTPFELGPFTLSEEVAGTGEGMKACQDYGRVFGEQLNK